MGHFKFKTNEYMYKHTNKHMKRCANPSIIKEMQIKFTLRLHTYLEWRKLKNDCIKCLSQFGLHNKVPSTGWHINNINSFLTVLDTGILRSGYPQVMF